MKFGKINTDNLKSTLCPIDSNAHAYTIFDYGNSYFEYDQSGGKGFQLYTKRHFRIKIVDKEGLEHGDVEIPLYQSSGGDGEERAIGIKAYTYNLENGKMVKSKLNKSDILKEETSKNWKSTKFAMPNVKEGSIIEVQYTIRSDFFFNLRGWYFQKDIPVLHSEYHVSIPEYFHYNQNQKGYFPIETKKEYGNGNIIFNRTQERVDYRTESFHYVGKNIIPFSDFSYLKTAKNYLSKVEFELASTKFPYSTVTYYSTSWEKVEKQLMKSFDFGLALKKSGHLKNDVATLKATGTSGPALMNTAFYLMKSKFKWNGETRVFLDESLAKAYKKGEGSSADINLNLVVLLRELGFKAFPVVLSTQKHGALPLSRPSLSKLNYVIAMVRLDGATYIMDATDAGSEINLLPIRCLNGQGRIIYEKGGDWVNLTSNQGFTLTSQYKLSLDQDLTLTGTAGLKFDNYAAYKIRKALKKYKDETKYDKALDMENVSIDNISVKGLDNINKGVILNFELEKSDLTTQTNDIIFFSPVLHPYIDENPFKLEERHYPVEYNHTYKIQDLYTIKIPEGYEVSELPKPLVLTLPNKAGRYIYQLNKLGNSLHLSSKLTINKEMFLPQEYAYLKQFYQTIIDKQNELVVLKKVVE